MAQGLLLLHAGRAGLGKAIVVQSAGTHVKLGGQRPDARAQRAAASVGADLSRMRSRQVQARDFAQHDYILGMDGNNRRYLLDACPAEHAHKVSLLMDFAPETGLAEVPDPYFGNYAGWPGCCDMCNRRAIDDSVGDPARREYLHFPCCSYLQWGLLSANRLTSFGTCVDGSMIATRKSLRFDGAFRLSVDAGRICELLHNIVCRPQVRH